MVVVGHDILLGLHFFPFSFFLFVLDLEVWVCRERLLWSGFGREWSTIESDSLRLVMYRTACKKRKRDRKMWK